MKRQRYALLLAGIILGALPVGGCHLSRRESADWNRQEFRQRRDWNQEKDLRVRMNFSVGNITLLPAPEDTLFSLEADYSPKFYRPVYEYDEASHVLRFELKELRTDAWIEKLFQGGNPARNKNRITVRLSPRTILEMELKAGVGTTHLDFGGMRVRSLVLETGIGETMLSCSRPNPVRCEHLSIHSGIGELKATWLGNLNFSTLEYKGGIGSSHLDFSGSWQDATSADIRAEMGIGELRLLLPLELGAEIRSSKHFLNDLKLDSFVRKGDRYLSKNYEEVSKHLLIHMEAGIGSMRVRRQ